MKWWTCLSLCRIEQKIYDEEEFEKAFQWVKANCQEGPDLNPVERQASREEGAGLGDRGKNDLNHS